MDSRHATWLAIGGTLLVVGGGGLLTLEGSGQGSHFRLVELVLLALTVVGMYGLFGPLMGLPMPSPRSYPFWQHEPSRELAAAPIPEPTPVVPALPVAAAEIKPSAPKRTKTAAGHRLLNRTPRQLTDLYGKLTDVQGKLVVAPNLGQWIEVEGTVSDVASAGSFIRLTLKEHQSVGVWFCGPEAMARLILLHAGDRVVVHGKIEEIDRNYVSLDPCELVDN